METTEDKIIGILCSYVPMEIIQAAGLQVERISIFENSQNNEYELLSYTCSFVKKLLYYLDGNHTRYSGLILTNSCHAMETLYEIVKERWNATKVHMVMVPPDNSLESIKRYEEELKKLIQFLEDEFQLSFTSDALSTAIRVQNEKLSQLLLAEQYLKDKNNSGFSIQRFQRAYAMNQEDINLKQIEKKGNTKYGKRPRILVYGSLYSPDNLIDVINECGGDVVYLATCNSFQNNRRLLEPSGDCIHNLASAYLEKRACGPLFSTKRICQQLRTIMKQYQIDAVIISIIKFCPDQVYSLIGLKEELKKEGYRCLAIEDEYSNQINGQIQTRMEAFFEQLSGC